MNQSSMDFTCDVKKVMENKEEIRSFEKIKYKKYYYIRNS